MPQGNQRGGGRRVLNRAGGIWPFLIKPVRQCHADAKVEAARILTALIALPVPGQAPLLRQRKPQSPPDPSPRFASQEIPDQTDMLAVRKGPPLQVDNPGARLRRIVRYVFSRACLDAVSRGLPPGAPRRRVARNASVVVVPRYFLSGSAFAQYLQFGLDGLQAGMTHQTPMLLCPPAASPSETAAMAERITERAVRLVWRRRSVPISWASQCRAGKRTPGWVNRMPVTASEQIRTGFVRG